MSTKVGADPRLPPIRSCTRPANESEPTDENQEPRQKIGHPASGAGRDHNALGDPIARRIHIIVPT